MTEIQSRIKLLFSVSISNEFLLFLSKLYIYKINIYPLLDYLIKPEYPIL